MELQYNENDRAAYYAEMDAKEIQAALKKARLALEQAEDLATEGYTFNGRRGPEWRRKDVWVARQAQARLMAEAGAFGGRVY